MSFQFLQDLLARRPFEPFVVHLSSGEVHEVRSPECAFLTKTRMVIANLETDHMIITSLLHIVSVEMVHTGTGV